MIRLHLRLAAALALGLTVSSCTLTRSDPGFPERRDVAVRVFEDDLRRSETDFQMLARPLSRAPATNKTRDIHAAAEHIRESLVEVRKSLRVFRDAQTKGEANGKELVKQLSDLRSEVMEFSSRAPLAIQVVTG